MLCQSMERFKKICPWMYQRAKEIKEMAINCACNYSDPNDITEWSEASFAARFDEFILDKIISNDPDPEIEMDFCFHEDWHQDVLDNLKKESK